MSSASIVTIGNAIVDIIAKADDQSSTKAWKKVQ